MTQKKWIPAFIVGFCVFFIIIASCRIDFPQKTGADKGQLWSEKEVNKSTSQDISAGLSEFKYIFRNLAKLARGAVVNVYTTTTVKQRQFMFPFDMFDDFFGDDFLKSVERAEKDEKAGKFHKLNSLRDLR